MTRPDAPRAGRRRDLVALLLLATVLFLPGLGARDLCNPSEPVYGLAVSEMADAGHPCIEPNTDYFRDCHIDLDGNWGDGKCLTFILCASCGEGGSGS